MRSPNESYEASSPFQTLVLSSIPLVPEFIYLAVGLDTNTHTKTLLPTLALETVHLPAELIAVQHFIPLFTSGHPDIPILLGSLAIQVLTGALITNNGFNILPEKQDPDI